MLFEKRIYIDTIRCSYSYTGLGLIVVCGNKLDSV